MSSSSNVKHFVKSFRCAAYLILKQPEDTDTNIIYFIDKETKI